MDTGRGYLNHMGREKWSYCINSYGVTKPWIRMSTTKSPEASTVEDTSHFQKAVLRSMASTVKLSPIKPTCSLGYLNTSLAVHQESGGGADSGYYVPGPPQQQCLTVIL